MYLLSFVNIPKLVSMIILDDYIFHLPKNVGWVRFFSVAKNVTRQLADLWGNVGLRYRALLDKLTQPTGTSYCLLIH